MGFLAVSSSVLVFCAGLGVIVCWTVVSGDKYHKDGDCGGCIYLLHQSIDESPSELKGYYKLSKNSYPYLLSFGIVIGVIWITTAFLVVKPRYYLVSGIIGAIAFICVFVPLLERMRRNQACKLYARIKDDDLADLWEGECKIDDHWLLKHMYDSYDLFWGSALAFIFISMYQMACAIALVYEEEVNTALLEKYRDGALEPKQEATIKAHSDSNSKRSQSEEVKDLHKETYTKCKTRDQEVSTYGLIKDESISVTPYDIAGSTIPRMASMIRRGEIPPPEESPVPSVEPADFSMNNT